MFFIVYLIIGVTFGFLAGLIGNGGLILVPSMIFALSCTDMPAHLTVHIAIGTSLAAMLFTIATTSWNHFNKGNLNISMFLLLTPGMLLGSWLGGVLINFINEIILIHILAICCMLAAWNALHNTSNHKKPIQFKSKHTFNFVLVSMSITIACIATLSGVGGAFLTMPLLLYLGFPIRQCIATASACAFPVALIGTCSYIILHYNAPDLPEHTLGYVYWPALLCLITTSIPASKLGILMSYRLKQRFLKVLLAFCLILIGLALLLKIYIS